MRNWLNKYFSFTKRELNGLLVLVVLILLVNAVPYAYGLIKAEDGYDAEAHAEMVKLSLPPAEKAIYKSYLREAATEKAVKKAVLFPFDPNVIGQKDWEALGLSARQAASILKYVAKGGKFRKKEDLQKMYAISEQQYARLLPFVRIAEDGVFTSSEKRTAAPGGRKTELPIIELNGADSARLVEVRGIGPAFANRIMKYRERIGGFYKKEQLMEVYGLDSVKYAEIEHQLGLDINGIRTINVNTATIEDFKNHPYIRYKQANALIQYRKQHGNYINIADLTKVAILGPETIARLAPYLTF